MTDLTKDWKDGKLPAGWYYIKIADIVFIDFFEGKVWKNKKDEYIDEVLALVPSYNEWKAKLEENAQLKKQVKGQKQIIESQKQTNFALIKRLDEKVTKQEIEEFNK